MQMKIPCLSQKFFHGFEYEYSGFPEPSWLYIQQNINLEDHLMYKKRQKNSIFIFLHNEVM